jgi:hypothetical protein
MLDVDQAAPANVIWHADELGDRWLHIIDSGAIMKVADRR